MGAWERGEGQLPELMGGSGDGCDRTGPLTLQNTEPPWLEAHSVVGCWDSWERHLSGT